MPYLTFDLRSLALMRIGIALVLVVDLSIRLSDLEVFYSNMGVLPLTLLFEHVWNPYFISVYAISGLWQVQLLLFFCAYFCAFMLLLGFRTNLFTALSWFLLLSLHNRNGLILQGGDDLLRMVLFWGMFLPWGRRYSCDVLWSTQETMPFPVISIACVAYLLQVSYLYTGSALLKGKEWDTEFSALYYVYCLDQISFPVTRYIFYHPRLLQLMTQVAYYFELLIPLFFFIPVKHGLFRLIGVAMIFIFHVLNEITLLIGLFPMIGIVTSFGILPSTFMDFVEKRSGKGRSILRDYWGRIGIWLRGFVFPPTRNVLRLDKGYVMTPILCFLFVYVLDWNYSNLKSVESKLPDHLRFIGYLLRLDQHWGMFAPNVLKDDGWYVLQGVTQNGDTISLTNASSVSYEKPLRLVSHFKNDRWRKYLENYMLAGNDFMRGYFCQYSLRRWQEDHPKMLLKRLTVLYIREFTLPNYIASPTEKIVLWECEP